MTEVKDGIVEIKSISREAGSRTKIAVWSNDPDVDPVGACVGLNGARVNAIVNELRGEKIDIINWSDNAAMLIENALSPAKVISVIADAEEKTAKVVVPDYQLSLAIGKEGQNARLAARLTGFKIDIKSETQAREAGDFMDYENDYEEYDEYEEEPFEEGGYADGYEEEFSDGYEEAGGYEGTSDSYEEEPADGYEEAGGYEDGPADGYEEAGGYEDGPADGYEEANGYEEAGGYEETFDSYEEEPADGYEETDGYEEGPADNYEEADDYAESAGEAQGEQSYE